MNPEDVTYSYNGEVNDNLVLICGESASGKTMSLKNLRDHKGVLYLNCEAGKKPPFKNNFESYTITDCYQVYEAFEYAEQSPHIHTIVVDSITFLMDLYESTLVVTATNTMKAWGEFQQYFKNLMQQYVAKSSKNVVFLAHTLTQLNEETGVYETRVPVKSALKNNGIEAYFSTILYAKRVKLKDLNGIQNDLLHITPLNEVQGFKHCFQTCITKKGIGEKIRTPIDMFSLDELYIDNDVQQVIDRLHEYYKED
jgi:hypothetical protein